MVVTVRHHFRSDVSDVSRATGNVRVEQRSGERKRTELKEKVGGSEAGAMLPQHGGVHHASLQGQVRREVSGRSLQALAGGSALPLRDGQLRVVSRERRGEEVGMEERLQRTTAINTSIYPYDNTPSDTSRGHKGSRHTRRPGPIQLFPAPYLSGGAALSGRINQELVEQVHSLGGRVREDLLQWDRWILLEGNFIVIWQLHDLLENKNTTHHAVM